MIEKKKQVFVCQLFRFVCSFLVLLSVEARHLSQIISLVTIVLKGRECTSTLVCITPLGRGVIHYMNFFYIFSLIFLRALVKDSHDFAPLFVSCLFLLRQRLTSRRDRCLVRFHFIQALRKGDGRKILLVKRNGDPAIYYNSR